jgi:hypothetical protein
MADLSSIGTNKAPAGLNLSEVGDVLAFYIDKIITDSKANLEEKGKIASHALSQSIRTQPIEIVTEAFGQKYIGVIIMEDYYIWVDQGRKPGKQPPINAIIQWMRYKPIKVNMDKLGDIRERGKNKRKPYTKEDLIKAKAFGIARKIGLKGTKPSYFFSSVFNEALIKDLNRDLGKALKRDVEVSFKLFNDNKEFLR